MKNVGFFDWKLSASHPLSYMKIDYKTHKSSHRPDVHSSLHLNICCSGKTVGEHSNTLIESCAQSICLISPWEPHMTVYALEDTKLLLLNIDTDSLLNFFYTGRNRLNYLLTMPPQERFEYLNKHPALPPIIEEIKHQMYSSDLENRMLMLWNTVLKFFIAALPEIDENTVLECNYQRLLPALEKLSGKVLTLSAAAELCNLSPSYFAVLFRKQFGLSFARYERNFRLNGAISAINHGTTFKEAAEEWGFFDKSHLARLIKQHK